MSERNGAIYVLLLAVLITAVAGATAVTGSAAPDDSEEFSEWCEDRNGAVINHQGMWDGGLHCHLSDGDLAGSEAVSIDEWRQNHGGASA